MKDISVIIRAYNEEVHIEKLLQKINEQSVIDNVEVILVDSGSTDLTVVKAQKYNVKLIKIESEVFTFGRALNVGIKNASGKYLVFASAHVYPTDGNWLENLVKPLKREKTALSYGRQIGMRTTKYSEHQIFKKWFPEESCSNQNHPFCNNANAAIKKELWLDQPYDETITGLEDLHWANKIMDKGYQIAYVAEANIVHVHDETYSQVYNRYFREAIAYKKIFPEAVFSFLDFLVLVSSNILFDLARSVYDKKTFLVFLSIFNFRINQFWGTFKGYKHKGPVGKVLKKRFYYPKRFKRL